MKSSKKEEGRERGKRKKTRGRQNEGDEDSEREPREGWRV